MKRSISTDDSLCAKENHDGYTTICRALHMLYMINN